MNKLMTVNKINRVHMINMLMALFLIIMTAGCQSADKSSKLADGLNQSTAKVDEIKQRGILKVGTAGDYQPMSYLDPKTGSYIGFDAELAEDLAASMGVKVEYIETS